MRIEDAVDDAGYGTGTQRDQFGVFTGGKTLLGKKIQINRWNEDGTKREELFDWEKESLNDDDLWKIPLNYIIKRPLNKQKRDVEN